MIGLNTKELPAMQSMILNLITYGCGDVYEPDTFKPIENKRHMKPKGGLWASPVGYNYGWREWGTANCFGSFNTQFEFTFEGAVLIIDSAEDMDLLDWRDEDWYRNIIDYERLYDRGIDAIYLTEKGEQETRYTTPRDMYGYDCECVLVLNPECIRQ